MLLQEILSEHIGWSLDKGLELDLASVIEAVASKKSLDSIQLSDKGITLKSNLLKVANELVGNATHIQIFGKPSGAKPTYGSGSEPKSDLNIAIGKKIYALSVKAGPAYAMSAGSKTEYHGICAASIALFEELYPILAAKTKEQILEYLIPIAETIGKSTKNSNYTDKALKGKKEGWFERGPEKVGGKITDKERSDFSALRVDAEKIIDDDNTKKKGQYKTMLAEMEGIAKSGIKQAFETEEFARCFIWEISSGVKKFNGTSEIKSFSNSKAAYANTIVYLNGKGVFDLSSQNSEYVTMSIKNHSVRLQNVPRGWVMTYIKSIRGGAEPSPQRLADALREIELSLKIGVGPGATGKIKESQLNEFVVDNILIKNLVSALKSASISSICNVFGIAATLT